MESPVLSGVLNQHAEDAAFLWLLRDRALAAPQFNLRDLAGLDGRVEAHVDGLRIAGDPGWEICTETLGLTDAGEVFACGILAFESGSDARIQKVLNKGATERKLARGLVSALGWLAYEKAGKHIHALIGDQASVLRWIGIAAGAIHRQIADYELGEALMDADPLVRARACRAAGELGQIDLLPNVRKNMKSEQEDCCFWANWALGLRADNPPLPMLLTVAEGEGQYRNRAMHIALRRLDVRLSLAWQAKIAENPTQLRLSIQAVGVIGAPDKIAWLIELMGNPALARLAAESFTMITGADLDRDYLKGDKPEGLEIGPTDNPEDEKVEMDPDEDLPWPDPELVRKWWDKHQKEFTNGSRYLLGKPLSIDWLQHVLRNGRQRHRAAAALELAMRQPGQPLFNTSAPGFRQQALLGLGRYAG
jgi:uncharacterized protein (TIGR02270 family)